MYARKTRLISICLILTISLVLSSCSSGYPFKGTDKPIKKALSYLSEMQATDGSIGSYSDTAWAVMALAACGKNPARFGSPSPIDFLKQNNHQLLDSYNITADLARNVLAIVASGQSPRSFGEGNNVVPGGDFIDALVKLHDGTQFGEKDSINEDFWALIALIGAGYSPDDEIELRYATVRAESSTWAHGRIYVKQTVGGKTAYGYFDITVYDAENPFAIGVEGLWPRDLSVGFGGDDEVPVKIEADTIGTGEATMFRLLLSSDPDNVWENKPQTDASGLWGTVTAKGDNILWTIVGGNEIYAFKDYNTGKVQNVTVKEVNKDATRATKTLEVSWTALSCTTVYEIYVDGAYFYWAYWEDVDAGTTLSVEIPNMDFATSYDVQVRAGDSVKTYGPDEFEGSLQSRLSTV